MADFKRLEFIPFLWRVVARALAEAAAFFELDVKTILTALVLLGCGFYILYRVKGLSATQDAATDYILLTAAPAILFLAGLILWNLFRAPYLIYIEEYEKASTIVTAAEQARTASELELARLRPIVAGLPELEQQKNDANIRAQKAEESLAKFKARSSDQPSAQRRLIPDQCTQLAQAIADYDTAINQATAAQFSDKSRARIEQEVQRIQDWLSINIGAVQRQSFVSAGPVAHVYSGLPRAHAGLWQISQGRLNYLKEIANRLCG